jgi:hypothetical protein
MNRPNLVAIGAGLALRREGHRSHPPMITNRAETKRAREQQFVMRI